MFDQPMFDQSFVDLAGKTNKSWTVTVSFALEFLAVGVMILIPLIWTEVLPDASRVNMLTAPAPPPPPPPPQPVQKVVRAAPRQFNGRTLQAPVVIPPKANMFNDEPLQSLNTAGVVSGLDTGLLSGLGTAGPGIGQAPTPPPPQPPPVQEPPKRQEGPLRQSSGVQSAKCVSCPRPQYPSIARQAHIQGTVVLQATIAKDGTVQHLQAVSSANPLLTQAALEAVKKWVYVPTILNQEPVEVITEITVNFSLQ